MDRQPLHRCNIRVARQHRFTSHLLETRTSQLALSDPEPLCLYYSASYLVYKGLCDSRWGHFLPPLLYKLQVQSLRSTPYHALGL